jgi:hypothetical protein
VKTHHDEQHSQQHYRSVADGAHTTEPYYGLEGADEITGSCANFPDRREEMRGPGFEPRQKSHGQVTHDTLEVMIGSPCAAWHPADSVTDFPN